VRRRLPGSRGARAELGQRLAAHARLCLRCRSHSAGPCERRRRAAGLDDDSKLLPETVTNLGITDATRFEQEVKKCFANPVTYPPAYPKPTW
jgi:hypothetical protein